MTVAIAVTDTPFAPVFIARALGYFGDAGVDVKFLDSVGSTGLTLLTSNQTDLLMFGPGSAFLLANQGKSAKLIYNFTSGGAGGVQTLAGSPITELGQLAGKRVGSLGVGGGGYGYAQLYLKYLESHGGGKFDIVQMANQGALINALIAKQVDAVVSNASFFAKQVADGSVRIVVDTRDPATVQKYIGVTGFPEGTIYGMAEVMPTKREAVVRFLEALDRATTYLGKSTPEDIAQTLKTLQVFGPNVLGDVTVSAQMNKGLWSPNRGQITEDQWKKSLPIYGLWGLQGIDVSQNIYGYAQLVDMSYLQEALARNR